MMKLCSTTAIAAVTTLALIGGCATHDQNRQAKTGSVADTIASEALGDQSGSANDKHVEAVVDTFTGAAVDNYMDEQQRELEKRLALESQNNQIEIVRVDQETLRLDIRSEASFTADSTQVNGTILKSLKTIAEIIGDYDKTVVHVTGHTDSIGAASYNQILSLRRASSVAVVLYRHGVDRPRLRSAGHGESQPLAANDTTSGRSRNRRVEVLLKSIVQGREGDAYRPSY